LSGSLRMKRRAFSEVTKSRSSSGSFPSFVVMRVSYTSSNAGAMCEIQMCRNKYKCFRYYESLHSPDQCNLLQGRRAFSPIALPIHIPYSKRRRVCHIRDMPT
jgi:hypothetical protein